MLPTTIEWRGLTLGPATAWQTVRIDGWEDMPPLDSGDEPRPARHGDWAGTPYAQARTITVEGRIRTSRAAVLDRVRDLRRACAIPDDDTLYPLTITALGERLTVDARVSQRFISHDKLTRLGYVPYTLQWTCPDPVRYEPEPVHVVIPAGGERQAPQHGSTRTRPVVTIYGPCTNPTITMIPVDGGTPLALGFDTTLVDGEYLTVDCQAGTAVYDDGTDASTTLATGSVPIELFTIPAGVPLLDLAADTSSGDARAHVTYRHAYL